MSSFDDSDAFEAAVPLSQQAMAARPMPYLDELNAPQREAVETLDGPVLMLAGAGTGKTKALTARIAHLMQQGRARPNEILAVTFTNKAAREMKLRVGNYLGHAAEGMPWLGTFHAICVKLLRRHAELIGYSDSVIEGEGRTAHLKSNFTILDPDDQVRLLKQLIQAAGIDDKRWPARSLAAIIDNWKNRAWTPDTLPTSEASAFDGKGPVLYAEYQHRLITLNAVDFGDLLLHMVTIFQAHPDILARYQNWFRYILVDEYQDTNVAQYLWLRLLAGGHKNICCVGDDDQSIYGWRGAEVGNILRFEKDFPGAKVIRLEQNYRSTPHILAAASAVIRGNANRLGKELWTAAEQGEKIRLFNYWDGEEEARSIGDEVEGLFDGSSTLARRRENPRSEQLMREINCLSDRDVLRGVNSKKMLIETLKNNQSFLANEDRKDLLWELASRKEEGLPLEPAFLKYGLNEIAILVRASHQMRAFEDRFLTIGLPYRVIGGPRFYERMEIRDAMAYFRVVVSPDDDLAFERIVNTPKRGVGQKGLQSIQVYARDRGIPLYEATRELVAGGAIKGKAKGELGKLIDGLDHWARLLHAKGQSHIELAQTILEESGYTDMWQNDKSAEAPGRLENLKELVKALEGFENLQGFLEHVSLIMDNENEEAEDKITIMTLHAAKGLEFPVVFLPGWEDGLFPSQRSMDESGVKGLEEERRLAYVGITRAEEICQISFAGNRRVFGQWQSQLPSRFIDELPKEHVEIAPSHGLYGDTGGGESGYASAMQDRVARADAYNSPGWKRMQANAMNRPLSQPRQAKNMVIDATAVSGFNIGDRVFHNKFGYGEIMAINGDKLEIEFDKAGSKNVIAKFIVPAAAAGDVPF